MTRGEIWIPTPAELADEDNPGQDGIGPTRPVTRRPGLRRMQVRRVDRSTHAVDRNAGVRDAIDTDGAYE